MTDTSDWFTGFSALDHRAGDVPIHARIGGRADAPPLVLLHGFPQNHAMWQRVVRQLAPHFRLVLPDLRGYGDSGKPPGDPAHVAYAKRTMAGDIADLMAALGHERYAVCGHDRGGRVAHRLALDHPAAVTRLAVLDIAPTLDMYQATDMRFATFYYHWFHLIQPSPLPETMIGGDRLFYLHWTLGGWGAGGLVHIEPEALASYERCFDDPAAVHAMCEDYRAASAIDLEHDRASGTAGDKIACDTLVLWGGRGVVEALFDPLALWQAQCAGRVSGWALDGGHYLAEELPVETATALHEFFG